MIRGDLRWFDAARGVAAFVVLIAHGYQVFWSKFTGSTDGLSIVLGIAAEYAVYAFFFMSGFLITLSIRNNISRAGRFEASEYAISRIARIYPPLIGAILIVICVGAVINLFGMPDLDLPGRARFDFSYREIWTAVTMRAGLGVADGPLWSLYIEAQIYILAGAVAMIGWSRKLSAAVLGAGIFYLGIRLQKSPYFAFYAAIWLLGSISSFARLPVRAPKPPAWLTASGGFSYSLYVIHFPLLLLGWSITQAIGFIGWTSMLLSMLTILPVAYGFSRLFEQTALFKGLLKLPRFIEHSPKPEGL